MLDTLLSLLWTLLVTCVMLALAYWFTRHIVGRMSPSGMSRGRNLEVMEQVAMGKEQRLMLVRVGKRVYILASTPNGITNLGELSEEEAAQLAQSEGENQSLPDGFTQTLRRVLEQRKRGGGGSHGRMD